MQRLRVYTYVNRSSYQTFVGEEVEVRKLGENLIVEVFDADGNLVKVAEFQERVWTHYQRDVHCTLEEGDVNG